MTGTLKSLESEKPILCTIPEAARHLTVSRSALYNLMDSGRLRYVKLGRSRRIKWADMLNLIDENTIGGDGASTSLPPGSSTTAIT